MMGASEMCNGSYARKANFQERVPVAVVAPFIPVSPTSPEKA